VNRHERASPSKLLARFVRKSLCTAGCLLLALGARGASSGDEVAVVYNTRLADSRKVAEHYALRRQVPTNQVFGLDLPTDEIISRMVFRNELQRPLAKTLEERKLWHIGSYIIPATNDYPAHVEWKVTESKIRYVVLCYGVPLKIAPDTELAEEGTEQVRPELRRNEAAVDSELAWLPLIEQKIPLSGPLRNPFYTVSNAAALHPTNGILMVTRLDGPTAEIAGGLVDKAIQAETDGLWGRAYFDTRGITSGGYALGDEWIRTAAEVARFYGFETIVDTNAETFSPAFPMSHIALYAGWYDSSVSGPFTRPVVEFMPGAFAYHLHSGSAATIRSPKECWVGPLLAKGATATMGSVYEPYLTLTPDMGVFFARFLLYGFTFGEAAYASQNTLSWQTTVIGDPLYRPFGKDPQQLHRDLERRGSRLIEWSHLRVINLNLARNYPLSEVVNHLEQLPATKTSAVLMEKLGDLYAAQGKPSSSAYAYQQAVKLDPSPQQRTRLMLGLAEKLAGLQRDSEACDVYTRFLEMFPDYPDKLAIYRKILPLAQKLKKDDADKIRSEIDRLVSSPPKP
jgi:uncharacterized protein (TIGR03790 family)